MNEPLDWARVPVDGLGKPKLRQRVAVWEKANKSQGRSISTRLEGRTLVLEAHEQPQARVLDSFLDHPGLTEQIAAALGYSARPWRPVSIREALGVPAIHRCVTLIAKTVGSMSLDVYRNGRKLAATERPRIAVRPDPFIRTHDFFRDTASTMATHGEAWWWKAALDSDGNALSVLNVDPARIVLRPPEVEDDQRYPSMELDGRKVDRWWERYIQITLMRYPGDLRGYGPLQLCGAASSVAVEGMEWAASFYAAGGYPNYVIKAAGQLGGSEDGWSTESQVEDGALSEAQRLKNDWISTANNTPKVIDDSIESVEQFPVDPSAAQALQARLHDAGEAARMFGIPGKLVEYIQSGASLTYQSLAEVKQDLIDTGVGIYYLEPIEQAFSDLLTRGDTARFNRFAFLQADIKTRYEVYELGVVKSGVLTADEAREMEGLEPGDVETAPVPMAPPSAFPTALPVEFRTAPAVEVRCDGMTTKRRSGVSRIERCGKLLSTEGTFVGRCPRCKKVYEAA